MKYSLVFLSLFMGLSVFSQKNPFRQVYLFSPSEKNADLIEQQQIFAADTEGVKERDLRLTVILEVSDKAKLFKRYKIVPDKFTFVLIGKDGGEKFRSSKIVSLQALFALIDGMPMRKDEMRKRR